MATEKQKKVLFFPLNSPGHINSSLGIADFMKLHHNCETVFLLLGSMIGTSIEDHGHQLVILQEATPYEDYEIETGDDTSVEVNEELMRSQGREKRKFEGVMKWPQIIRRYSSLFRGDPVDSFVDSLSVMESLMVGELRANHASYSKAIEEIAPDLIVVDAYFIPPCVVKSKVPWVRLFSACPLGLVKSKLPNGLRPPQFCGFRLFDKETRMKYRNEQPEKWEQMLESWRKANEKIQAAMKTVVGSDLSEFMLEHGCAPLAPGKQAHDSPHLNIYMYPKAMDFDQEDDLFEYPKRWVRCDSLMRQESQAGSCEAEQLDEWKAKFEKASMGKEAVVFFSLGSIASGDSELMSRYVSYLKCDQKRLYVVSKGVNGDKYQLDENNMIGGNYIPQAFFLQNCHLAIVHGGNNSVTECMYYGKPMIVLPIFADQLDNAKRVEDLKLGHSLDVHSCDRKQLLDTIEKVLANKQMIEKTNSIGRQMRSRDDIKQIAGLLEKLIRNGSLDDNEIQEYQTKSLSDPLDE